MTGNAPAGRGSVLDPPSIRARSLWAGVDSVIDRAQGLADLRAHRLHLLAAARWRELERPLPSELADEEFRSGLMFMSAKAVLGDVRAACEGPLLVLKGPHTASFYPAPLLRPFSDVDVLAGDPERAYAALVTAGFEPIGFEDAYYRGLHHLRPLLSRDRGIVVEVHRFPNWFSWGDPPLPDELMGDAETDILGITGLSGLAPGAHALVLAAHSWVELPFRRLSDLVDVAAVDASADRAATAQLARRWEMERVWQTTITAADAMFAGAPAPRSLRVSARNFLEVRDRTVQETHVRRLIAGFWVRPPLAALADLARQLWLTLLPSPSDSWATKLARGRLALRNRSQPSAEHGALLGQDARRAPRFRRRR